MTEQIIQNAERELRSVKAKIRTGDFLPLGLDWRDRTAASENLRGFAEDLGYWANAMRRAVRRNDPECFEEAREHFAETNGDLQNYVADLGGLVRMGW